MQPVLDCSLESKLGKSHEGPSPPQHSDDDLFAPSRGKNRDTDVEPIRLFRRNVSILGDSAFADIELRQNFDPDNEVFMHPSRNFESVSEQAIDPVANSSRALARLDVDVAGIHRRGFFEDHFLDTHDRRTFLAGRTQFFALNNCW